MKRIYNLVITGGPCAGKSIATAELKLYLEKEGFRVFVIPEVATYLMKNGIVPYNNCISTLAFQTLIFKYQLFQENLMKQIATELEHDSRIVILEDRGLMDNKIYLSDTEFEEILKSYDLTEAEIMSRYDLIIHLISTSVKSDDFYEGVSNEYRMENSEEAKELSNRCIKVWGKHPRFITIDVTPTLEEKMRKIKTVVKQSLNF